jgi:hypothetical protein
MFDLNRQLTIYIPFDPLERLFLCHYLLISMILQTMHKVSLAVQLIPFNDLFPRRSFLFHADVKFVIVFLLINRYQEMRIPL